MEQVARIAVTGTTVLHPCLWVKLMQRIWRSCKILSARILHLTHRGQDKMTAISQTAFSNAFPAKENVWILITTSLTFDAKDPIDKSVLVAVMAWCRTGDEPLPEPMLCPASMSCRAITSMPGSWVVSVMATRWKPVLSWLLLFSDLSIQRDGPMECRHRRLL